MFDGMPEQFHQFIASRAPSQLPPSLSSFSLHGSAPTTGSFSPFEPYPSLHLQPQVLPHQLHQHPSPPTNKNEEKEAHTQLLPAGLEMERERLIAEQEDLWTNEEVLELLRIRSGMENWFPDFTWNHVSRKLAELGFQKSPEKCKEKFEEESRHLSSIHYGKNYRFFSELEEICHGDQNPQVAAGKDDEQVDKMGQSSMEEGEEEKEKEEDNSRNETVGTRSTACQEKMTKPIKGKKRKRQKKFEILKGFCEEVVNKMMAQQEELNNKLIEDMVKRDEEKVAREEAWKKHEMERINKEIEIRAHEHAIASDRQAKIIEFLNKITSNSPTSVPSLNLSPNPNSICHPTDQNKLEAASSSSAVIGPQSHSPLPNKNNQNLPTSTNTLRNLVLASIPPSSTCDPALEDPNAGLSEKDDIGKRWPRDEVLALINLRCNHYRDEREGSAKGPLWERISQGMLELGYKRSAKRCKEKWENINKYFRKTKDANKKRSADSRTCPYFHQLSTLYSQGALGPENHSVATENHSSSPENNPLRHSPGGFEGDVNLHVGDHQGEKNDVQVVPAVDF